MQNLFILCAILFSLPTHAGTGVPNDFKEYAGNYFGRGSQITAKDPSCSVKISERSVNGRKTIQFSVLNNDRSAYFYADAEELTRKIKIGKNEYFMLTLGAHEMIAPLANPGCEANSFVYVGVWTRNLEFSNGLKIMDGDLNYVGVFRSLDCEFEKVVSESFVCGRLYKQETKLDKN